MAGEAIEIRSTIDKWAEFTVKRWQENLVKMRVDNTGALMNSFLVNIVEQSGGSVEKINFKFMFYGRFIDMGVGKGVKVGGVVELRTQRREGNKSVNKRKPKKWYSKSLAFNVTRLSEIMAEKYGKAAGLAIKEQVMIK
jgi:hypothetical protein